MLFVPANSKVSDLLTVRLFIPDVIDPLLEKNCLVDPLNVIVEVPGVKVDPVLMVKSPPDSEVEIIGVVGLATCYFKVIQ